MNDIIVNTINCDNIYLRKLKFSINYYIMMNSSYDLNIEKYHFSVCDKIITILTLFILFIYLILESLKSVKSAIIHNTFFKLWIILFVSDFYILFNYFVRKNRRLYEEFLYKYNFFKQELLIYLSIIVSFYFLFNITFHDFLILLHYNSLFCVLIFLRIFIKIARNSLIYILSQNAVDNYFSNYDLTIDEKNTLSRIMRKNLIFNDNRFLKHSDFKLVNYDSELGIDKCVICYIDYRVNEEIIKLPCGHHFHKCCMLNWVLNNCSCPLCRTELLIT